MRASRLAKVFVCLMALCLAGVGPVLAQTGKGSIAGTVNDPNGEGLPGVAVAVSQGSVMGPRTVVTGASGDYRVPALLPDDDYVLTFSLDGFQTVVREGIRVLVGQTTNLPVTLGLSAVADEIVVSGETPMVDVESPASNTNFGADLLENIPNTRSWTDAMVQAPGLVAQAGSGSTSSSRGGAVVNNDMSFDGVKASTPLYNTSPGNVVYESVQEVQIMTGGLPAEIGNMSGAYVNVVTKSGGNEFRGTFSAYFENESWQGNNVTDDLRAQGISDSPSVTDYTDYSVNLGGPIARDKVWFNAAYWKYG